MKVLHITDFHYSSDNKLMKDMIDSIINKIKESNHKFDFILFTGDLVFNGTCKENFEKACDVLLNRFAREFGINKEYIIICPGNHDIDRGKIHSALYDYFDNHIKSNKDLDIFYKEKPDTFLDSVKPLENYRDFIKGFYKDDSSTNIFKDLYSIHYRVIGEETIGFVCLNSSWLSNINKSNHEDLGKLMIPSVVMEEISMTLRKDLSKKILLLHHPLYFLKDDNRYEIENCVYNNYDMLFYGHVHKINSMSRHTGSNGIFEHMSRASLTSESNLGCSIITMDDIDDTQITTQEIIYIPENKMAVESSPIVHHIPCDTDKERLIKLRKKIHDKYPSEKDGANSLLLINEDSEKQDFLSLYNPPRLKTAYDNEFTDTPSTLYSYTQLIETDDSFIIYGKDKCGKTSLLKRLQLEYLQNYSKRGLVPFLIDAKEYEAKVDDKFDLVQHIRNYYGLNREDTNKLISDGTVILLIDNFKARTALSNYLNQFLLDNSNIRFVFTSEYNLTKSIDDDILYLGTIDFKKLYFHDLRRQEIVCYAEKRLSNHEDKEKVEEKIIQLCKQMELPLNYWTISLLLMIHHKSSDTYSKNLFSILDICVDEIFGKKKLLYQGNKASFDQLKTICASVAAYLFYEHSKTIYSATADEIKGHVESLLSQNERIAVSSIEIFKFFLSCGILKATYDNRYVFRLNGFFEYFLALNMTNNRQFIRDVLDNEDLYLGFKNQLEIYSGFRRDDLEFLKEINDKTLNRLCPLFNKYSSNKDDELLKNIGAPQIMEEKCRQLSVQRTLSSLEKAELEDMTDELKINSDVHLVNTYDAKNNDVDTLERYLSILARVFRNMDGIMGQKELTRNIFRFIIDSYCNLSFQMVEEYTNITDQELKNDEYNTLDSFPELDLLRYISNFSPMIAQVALSDSIGHYTMERMIKNEIKETENNIEGNLYKLYLLYFLLLDIDLKSNITMIDDIMKNLKLPVLKYMSLFKLNYYLAFKAGNNHSLQQTISSKIQLLKKQLDNKVDIGAIQKDIHLKKRKALLNKKGL